ncbi:MAG: lysophospholipid acyltransferase family protein, partial [Cyclobacteriaceae bacterium]
QYIFCPNHFSFLDIPVMAMVPVFSLYTGKESIKKVPLFGYMFSKIHIAIDRSTSKGRYEAYQKYEKAIDQGKSLIIFPEGGIWTEAPPKMSKFKDGPFKTAIIKQIPIIPVTIPYNWIILPDNGKYLFHWHRCKAVYHNPIETNGMTMEQMEDLKQQVYQTIDAELKKHNKK